MESNHVIKLIDNMTDENFPNLKIFAGTSSRKLAQKVADQLNLPLGENTFIRFSEGNLFTQIDQDVNNQTTIIIQSIAREVNDEFMELLFWVDALRRSGAKSVNVVLPYFSYAKSDKSDGQGTSIRGRVCADCLEVIGADRVFAFDLHSPQVQGFFKKPLVHLSVRPLIVDYLKNLNFSIKSDLVIVSPDAGFEKTARLYADDLGVELAIGEKIRTCHDEKAEVLQISGADVADKIALITDDFTLTGGTLRSTAQKLRQRGVREVWATVAHNLLNAQTLKEILTPNENLDYLDKLMITDTVEPNFNLELMPELKNKITILSVAPLLAQSLQNL